MRVVCGLSETIATFAPTMRLRSVDLPALGRPMSETRNPACGACSGSITPQRGSSSAAAARRRNRTLWMRRRSASSTSTEAVELEGLPHRRHAADPRQHVAADGLEAVRLDLDAEPIAHLVDVHLRAEDARAVALVDDRLGLDVVLVADLADDLLEQILERDQARRCRRTRRRRWRSAPACAGTPSAAPAPAWSRARTSPAAPDGRSAASFAGRRRSAESDPSRTRCRGCCRGSPCNTGMREYSCSRNSARSSSSVASARIATMSGRGVMTSRTSVSPKSTIDCSSAALVPLDQPLLFAGSRYACAASSRLLFDRWSRPGDLPFAARCRRSAAPACRSADAESARRSRTAAAAARAPAPGCGAR